MTQIDDMCTLSYYKTIASLSEQHSVYLVQHVETKKIYVKKIMTVYNIEIFRCLKEKHISNTPKIYEVIEENNKLIVIEEYLTGESLQEMLDKNGSFEEPTVIGWIRQLCGILGCLHNADPAIVHRDIKPSNILVSPDGILKLLDMNAAKYSSEQGKKDTVLIGTVGYAAPEQYGFGASNIQTDIYAIGILMNVLLTGAFPQEQIATGNLKKIIETCTRLDSEKRYKGVEEILSELNEIQGISDKEKKNYAYPFAPPGFRSSDLKKMIFAGIGYLFMIWFCVEMTVEPYVNILQQWLNRVMFFVIAISEVFFWGNYLDIQQKMGVYRLKNSFIRFCAKIVFSFLWSFVLLVVLVLLENIFVV